MSWVKPKERRYILRWYSSPEVTNDEIASDLGMSITEFFEACIEVGLRPREEPDIYVPTQEEIARAAAEIRLGWDSETAESRMRVSRGSDDLGGDVDCGHDEEGLDL
jgi:hypothetical protein